MSKKNDRLDPRVRRTRKFLMEALIELIQERGYKGIKIQDITDRATLNRATFYLHYRDKDDLLRQTTKNLLDELLSEIKDIVVTGGGISVEAAVQTHIKNFEHVQRFAEFYRAMLGSQGSIAFAIRLENYVYSLTTNRFINAFGALPEGPVPADIALRFAASSYVGIIRWWLEEDMPFTPDEMAAMVVEMNAHGLFKAMGVDASE
jgi:AcrR family transcriptional regulator